MLNFRTLLFAGAMGLAAVGSASAQGAETQNISLAGLAASNAVTRFAPAGAATTNFSIRAGAMVTPRGAALIGGDVDLPTLSLGNGWHGRLDADFLIKANFGGVNSVTLVTFDQLYYSPNAASGHNVYWGGGLGAIFGGGTTFDGKLILGTELTTRIGAELNVHFNSRDTILALMARIHI
jgi:hypothetical protein